MIPHEGPQVKEWLNGKCGQWQMLNLQLWPTANIDELQMNNGKCWIANDELQMLSCNCARANLEGCKNFSAFPGDITAQDGS